MSMEPRGRDQVQRQDLFKGKTCDLCRTPKADFAGTRYNCRQGVDFVPKPQPGDDNVGRMQFLLALRKRGIGDANVLRAMDEVPREHFVDRSFVSSAYADQALPIACGQTISQPYVVAYMTEHLGVQPEHR